MDDRPVQPLPNWARALLQSGLVAVYILLAFFAIYRFHAKLAMASLGASAFIAFGFPTAESARSRYMLGGYGCGVVCGAACCFLHGLANPLVHGGPQLTILFCALAVFLASLAMILLNLQHPPAVAAALSMVLEPRPLLMGLSLLLCIAALCGMRWLVVKLLGKRLPWKS